MSNPWTKGLRASVTEHFAYLPNCIPVKAEEQTSMRVLLKLEAFHTSDVDALTVSVAAAAMSATFGIQLHQRVHAQATPTLTGSISLFMYVVVQRRRIGMERSLRWKWPGNLRSIAPHAMAGKPSPGQIAIR